MIIIIKVYSDQNLTGNGEYAEEIRPSSGERNRAGFELNRPSSIVNGRERERDLVKKRMSEK